MRRYDDPVDVRRGQVTGAGGAVEGPEQFLWKGRLWKVSAVVAQWVETGAWWQSSGVHAVLGAEDWAEYSTDDRADDRAGGRAGGRAGDRADGSGAPGGQTATAVRTDLSAEREVWRVQAARGMGVRHDAGGVGVFDLVFDWADGSWRLSRCLD